MLAEAVGLVVLVVALLLFAGLGLSTQRSTDVDDFVVARSSQSGRTLGLSFLASGLGGWILFAVPEIGAFVGLDGVIGYALASAAPILLFGAVGPALRRLLPDGHTLGDVARYRFGPVLRWAVGAVSILYMLTFLAAELTAAGAVGGVLAGLDDGVVIVALAVATLGYTAVRGLRASLRTDRWQAWLIVALLAIALLAMAVAMDAPGAAVAASGLLGIDRVGVEAAVTLVIAVICANLFHQGYWQRVWSAVDDRALRRGAVIGAVGSAPIVLLAGFVGIAAVGADVDLGTPAVPFFALLGDTGTVVAAAVLFLAVALVASSVDTIESGLAAIVAPALGQRIGRARLATTLLVLPAVVVALQGLSVLRLLLVADLLAAAIVVPALAVLWPRASSWGAIAGCVAGIVGATVPGWLSPGTVVERLGVVSFASGVPTLAPFVWALGASAVATIVVSLQRPDPARTPPARDPGSVSTA